MNLRLLAFVTIAAAACSHGATPPPVEEPPIQVSQRADAAVDADAAVGTDAAVDATTDAPPAGTGGVGAYRTTRLIKGTITGSEDTFIEMEFERPVRKGWSGDLWDEASDRPVPGAGFVIAGARGNVAGARLEQKLSAYGEHTTVRVQERYDGK